MNNDFISASKILSQKFVRLKKKLYFCTRFRSKGVFQSGQMGQTVNLLSFDFGGSNPSAPTSSKGSRTDVREPFFNTSL